MEKTVVELFAGVGGFRCGLNKVQLINNEVQEKGLWKFVWANQWEPSTKTQPAFECYTQRFGKSENNVNRDINIIDKTKIPNHNLLVGGFPCQDYSVARTISNEKGIKGKKGVLWWDIVEILEAKKPAFVLLENVDRLLRSPSKQRGRDFGVMLRSFLENEYGVQWRVINAGEYGFPQKRRRIFIFAYHKSTNYYKNMEKKSLKKIIFNDGIFPKNFPIKNMELKNGKTSISSNEYEDLVDMSENFEFHFYNSGVMHEGKIKTVKTEPNCEDITNLKSILEDNPVDEKYFLNEEKLKKFTYLKGKKRIQRKRPNGETYCFSEGSIPFPEKLDIPARTMLTSEGTTNRSTHVVKDKTSGKLRILTPIECERINMFPDNWTNIQDKSMTERRRYFMMGNALVVGIIDKLGEYLEKIFEKEE
ncbi:DNA (cytosine-5-)-methyltransferase [Methanobrevibacter sp. UBA337]|jgi:DNA (cytosine-5)-methyltransferase 1|uniref:DNA (cytosine-5-)-methyltransferase n=1 Tax=Methanobrevibacter sp. UBA337 TaxID=1915480 RepID=UPI0039B8218A